MTQISPKVRSQFDSLSPSLQNAILEKNVSINTLYDLIGVLDEIIREAGTSKGTFYHYFDGKDALLSSLSYLFDDKYEELLPQLKPETDSFDKLIYLNRELFGMIETSVSRELLASLYSSQLITRGEKHLLDQNRLYYRLLNEIVSEGQKKGELTSDMSSYEITKLYALCERALLYDWCICNGEYPLKAYGARVMPMLLDKIRQKGKSED